MARRLRDAVLNSREARRKLTPRGEPYFRCVEKGVHLGYRRRANAAGTWLIRHFNGTGCNFDRLASADDFQTPTGQRSSVIGRPLIASTGAWPNKVVR